ncbi:hypothetical protein ACET3Z_022093 [Daucus carota]
MAHQTSIDSLPRDLCCAEILTSKFLPILWTFDFIGIFAYGLAFDPLVSDHFKFVVFVEETKGCFKSKAFSSEGLIWSDGVETEVLVNHALPYSGSRGVYLNGVLYWELRDHSLLAYDVDNDTDCVIELPPLKKKTKVLGFTEAGCLGVSKGKLLYCRLVGTVIHVWQTKQMPLERSGHWATKHKINLCDVMRVYPEMKFQYSQALTFLNDCHGILLSIRHGVIELRFGDNAVQNMYKACRCVSRKNMDAEGYIQPSMFFPFMQSLALFNI